MLSIKNSLLSKTNQMWKFYLFNFFLVLSVVLLYFGFYYIEDTKFGVSLILLSLFVGLFGFAFSSFSIRCPSCRLRWMYWAVKTKNNNGWLSWLLNVKKCPKCNFGEVNK